MSDNPFSSPTQNPGNQPMPGGLNQAPAKAPGVVTAIAVISLILGAFGLFSACAGVGGFFLNKAMMSQFETMADDPGMKMQLDIQRAQAPYMMGNMVLFGFNFLIGCGLIIGAIMIFARKSIGPGLLKKTFLAAVLFCICRLVLGVVTQLGTKEAVMEAMRKGPNPELTTQMFAGMFWVGVVFLVIQALVLIGFYLFGFNKLGGDVAKTYFKTFN